MAIVATTLKRAVLIPHTEGRNAGSVSGSSHRTPGKGNAPLTATTRVFQDGKLKSDSVRFQERVDIVETTAKKLKFLLSRSETCTLPIYHRSLFSCAVPIFEYSICERNPTQISVSTKELHQKKSGIEISLYRRKNSCFLQSCSDTVELEITESSEGIKRRQPPITQTSQPFSEYCLDCSGAAFRQDRVDINQGQATKTMANLADPTRSFKTILLKASSYKPSDGLFCFASE